MNQLKLFDQNTLFFYGTEQYEAFCEYCNRQEDRCIYSSSGMDRLGYFSKIKAINKNGTVAIWRK